MPLPDGYDPHDDSIDVLHHGINDYVKQRRSSRHAPSSPWPDHSKTKLGYEIPFTRIFYHKKPPRPLAEIDADIKQGRTGDPRPPRPGDGVRWDTAPLQRLFAVRGRHDPVDPMTRQLAAGHTLGDARPICDRSTAVRVESTARTITEQGIQSTSLEDSLPKARLIVSCRRAHRLRRRTHGPRATHESGLQDRSFQPVPTTNRASAQATCSRRLQVIGLMAAPERVAPTFI